MRTQRSATRSAMSSRTSRIRSMPSMPRSEGSSVSQHSKGTVNLAERRGRWEDRWSWPLKRRTRGTRPWARPNWSRSRVPRSRCAPTACWASRRASRRRAFRVESLGRQWEMSAVEGLDCAVDGQGAADTAALCQRCGKRIDIGDDIRYHNDFVDPVHVGCREPSARTESGPTKPKPPPLKEIPVCPSCWTQHAGQCW